MSHSNSSKVGEIFTAAGAAFTKLGELTMTLHSVGEPSPSSGKWTMQEMEMLKTAVKSFGTELERINDSIKNKNIEIRPTHSSQMKAPVKRKSFEDPNIGIKKQMPAGTATIKTVSQDKIRALNAVISQSTPKSEITLNMLNAMEPEVDVEGLTSANKLDYDSPDAS
ncbi:chromatin complexes subunit BAP18-like isoform X2 [Stegodyphus dumicola]|uniref:chromatin complexes subunit BAP18-like isoform X2 n=1 Tax=Stegodyphus dumicola TaxID=202533 RepID=UPI0015B0176C|nr:chromatin complexes subunit BAP18-like isoform X2 [Stegodyphus dumicola]